eukprot:1159193-Pelagomonas_calceolata.AAC.4
MAEMTNQLRICSHTSSSRTLRMRRMRSYGCRRRKALAGIQVRAPVCAPVASLHTYVSVHDANAWWKTCMRTGHAEASSSQQFECSILYGPLLRPPRRMFFVGMECHASTTAYPFPRAPSLLSVHDHFCKKSPFI